MERSRTLRNGGPGAVEGADEPRPRDHRLVEDDLGLLVLGHGDERGEADAGRGGVDEEEGDAVGGVFGVARSRGDEVVVGGYAVLDEELGAVEGPVLAAGEGANLDAAGVVGGAGLGEAEAELQRAVEDAGEVFSFLRFRPQFKKGEAALQDARLVGDGARLASDFLHEDDEVGPRARASAVTPRGR